MRTWAEKIKEMSAERLKDGEGVTLAEMLVATLILSLSTLVITQCVSVASRHFVSQTREAEAQMLCSALTVAIQDELLYAREITTENAVSGADSDFTYFSMARSQGSKSYLDTTNGRVVVRTVGVSDEAAYKLVSDSSYEAANRRGVSETGDFLSAELDAKYNSATGNINVELVIKDSADKERAAAKFSVVPTASSGVADARGVGRTKNEEYTVSFFNDDGSLLESLTGLSYGTDYSYSGATPTKADDARGTYTFAGWTPSIGTVTGNMVHYAVYNMTPATYTVTWKNGEDVLKTDTVAYGTVPSYGGEPTKDGEIFLRWTPEVAAVTGDVTYMAVFSANVYTVTWKNGEDVLSERYKSGDTPVYKGETPTKKSENGKSYTFSGWKDEGGNGIGPVSGDVTYIAQFEEGAQELAVVFNSMGGTTVAAQTVKYNETAQEPDKPPVRTGYTFDKWYSDKECTSEFDFNTPVTEAIKLYAGWTPIKYTVEFDANGGEIGAPTGEMATMELEYGKSEKLRENGFELAGYRFDRWNTEKDGTGISYSDERLVSSLIREAGIITLYAQWKRLGASDIPNGGAFSASGKFTDWEELVKGDYLELVGETEGTTVKAKGASADTTVEELIIPDSCKSISEGTFASWSGLKTVTIQGGLNSIGKEAFANCNALERVVIKGTVALVDKDAFGELKDATIVYNGRSYEVSDFIALYSSEESESDGES